MPLQLIPLIVSSLGVIQRQIARRAVTPLGWARQELAERTGIAVDSLNRFEQTGQVSLSRLLKIAVVLEALQEFTTLFPEPTATPLDELATRVAARRRFRARGRQTQPITSTGTAVPTPSDDAARVQPNR